VKRESCKGGGERHGGGKRMKGESVWKWGEWRGGGGGSLGVGKGREGGGGNKDECEGGVKEDV